MPLRTLSPFVRLGEAHGHLSLRGVAMILALPMRLQAIPWSYEIRRLAGPAESGGVLVIASAIGTWRTNRFPPITHEPR